MKRIITLLMVMAVGASAWAQLAGDGYYRVKNAESGRYVYVMDNRGHFNWGTSDADMNAIQLCKYFSNAVSDPATVLYAESKGGRQYDLRAQGTGIYQIISYYISILDMKNGYYRAYGTDSGLTKYLSDGWNTRNGVYGYLSTTRPATSPYLNWEIKSISNDSDSLYFAAKPEVSAGGKLYRAMYASFPMHFESAGLRALYIDSIDAKNGFAIVKEFTGKVIPASTAFIIECPSMDVSKNKINPGGKAAGGMTGNLLKGVYFDYTVDLNHLNYTPYDANTMRVLGTLPDGSLGFVKAAVKNVPRNRAYLPVPAGSAEMFKVGTREEYVKFIRDLEAAGIDGVEAEANGVFPADVYNLSGMKVRSNALSLYGLPHGIYIVKGRKMLVK